MQGDLALGLILLSMLLLTLGVVGCLIDSEGKRRGDEALAEKRRQRVRRERCLGSTRRVWDDFDDTMEIVNRGRK